ncbi:MAG: hypothetical protein ACRDMX_11670, partial [Solirubrobacteraceae bacterium]
IQRHNAPAPFLGDLRAGSYGAGERTLITDQLSAHNQATLAHNADGTVVSSTDPTGTRPATGAPQGI